MIPSQREPAGGREPREHQMVYRNLGSNIRRGDGSAERNSAPRRLRTAAYRRNETATCLGCRPGGMERAGFRVAEGERTRGAAGGDGQAHDVLGAG